jgi:hypothetical protein
MTIRRYYLWHFAIAMQGARSHGFLLFDQGADCECDGEGGGNERKRREAPPPIVATLAALDEHERDDIEPGNGKAEELLARIEGLARTLGEIAGRVAAAIGHLLRRSDRARAMARACREPRAGAITGFESQPAAIESADPTAQIIEVL